MAGMGVSSMWAGELPVPLGGLGMSPLTIVPGQSLPRADEQECKACGQLLAPLNDQIVPARSLQLNSPLLGDVEVNPGADIRVTLSCLPNTLVFCYKLPDKGGKVYHLRHQDTAWADELFEAYQQEASGTVRPLFERKPLKGVCRVPVYS